jgi:hypothetical protein
MYPGLLSENAIWATNTAGNPGAYLAVQNDGNLVVYNAAGTKALWASGTVQTVGVGEPHPSEGTKSIGFVGMGDPNSDGTATALSALSGSSTLCQRGNPTVIAFQNSYNSTNPSTPLDVDGDYGINTQNALQSVVGTGPVPQACTSFTTAPGATTYTAEQLVSLANAVIADTSICNASASSPNQNVLAFQSAYNQVYNASLSIDGEYGNQTAAAMSVVGTQNSLSGSIPAACSQFASLPGSATQGSATASASSAAGGSGGSGGAGGAGGSGGSFNFGPYVPWLIGAVAVAGGVGIMMYLGSHKEHMVASKHTPKHAHKKLLPARKTHRALPAHKSVRRLPRERTTTVVYK